jgi:hypothetical protein
MLELLHGRMFLLASPRGSLGGDDDPALEAFVQVPAKHDVKLFLGEADNGGHVFALLAIAAVEHDAHARAVPDTQRGAVAEEQSIVALLDAIRSKHRLRVAAPVIEQHLHPTEIVAGERRAMDGRFNEVTGVVGAQGAIAENGRLEAVAAPGSACRENLPGDAHMPPLHHHAWKFAKHFDQFIKHAMSQQTMPPRQVASAQEDQQNMNAAAKH